MEETLLRLVPELKDLMAVRLRILDLLSQQSSPIGRKLLAQEVQMSERSLRTQLAVLRDHALIDVTRLGIELQEEGRLVLERLVSDPRVSSDQRRTMERALEEELGLKRCYLVDQASSDSLDTFQALALQVQTLLAEETSGPIDVAVTGGTTLANLAQYLTPDLTRARPVTFVSSRGGVSGTFHIQSNTVAGLMAQATKGTYLPLYLPDSMSQTAYQEVQQDPSIQEVLTRSRQAQAILLSVGSAQVMAGRRQLSSEEQDLITQKQVVGEAFGSFYNRDGEVIFSLPRIGVQLEDLQRFPLILTIVAGGHKALATRGFFQLLKQEKEQVILICDKSLAYQVLNGETQLNNKS